LFSSGIQLHVIELQKHWALGLFFILNCRMFVGKEVYWENSFGYRPRAVQLNTKWEFIYLHYFYRTPTVSSDTIIIINVILRAEWLPITDIRKNADQRKLCTYLRLSIFYNSNENCFQFCEWFLIIIYIIMYSTMLYDNDNNNCYYYNINNIFDYIIIY
jgi:hypothetical protein